jgi:hypothetical protein
MPARALKAGHHGGAGNCAACSLPPADLDRINDELVRHVSLSSLERRWGISRPALRAHRANHISPAWTALRLERNTNGVRKVADRIEDEIKDAARMYLAAAAALNMPLAIKAKHLLRQHLELLARVTGELDEKPEVTVNIQQTPAFILARDVIFSELEGHPEIRRSISRRLSVLADTGTDPGVS